MAHWSHGEWIPRTRNERIEAWANGPAERPMSDIARCDNCGSSRSDVLMMAENYRIPDPICCEIAVDTESEPW
jgi:hypothetical protein